MTDHKDFVIYAYSRLDWTFYYIGKGRPYRPYVNKRRVKKPEDKRHIHILHKGLDNKTAVDYEKKLIMFYGRKDKNPEWGILRNLTDGGEGTMGYVFTEQHKGNISKSNSGKKRTESQKRNMSQCKLGKLNPMYGKPSPTRGDKNHLYRPLNWFHPICGEVYNKSVSDLPRMYPEQNLKVANLCRVRRGINSNHKGWRTISCPIDWDDQAFKWSDFTSKSGKNHPRYRAFNWFHPVCGEILGKSSAELCKMFPEQNLTRANLTKVAKRVTNHHKGWVAIKLP